MIQRYFDVADGNLTSLEYRQGRKKYLTLNIWIGSATTERPRKFFVLCPHCNSGRVQVEGLKNVYEDFISDKKKDKMFLKCIKCEKKFLVDDLIIGSEIRKNPTQLRKFQLYIKSYDSRPDFESEIITAVNKHDAATKFQKRYFPKYFSWDFNTLLNCVVDMTDRI